MNRRMFRAIALLSQSALLLFILTSASVCRADEQPAAPAAPEQAAPVKRGMKQLVGAGVPEFTPLAGEATKNTMYLLAFVLIGLSLFKKFKVAKIGKHSSEAIDITARKSIGPRTSLLLVTAEGRKMLLAQSGDAVTLLTVLDSTPAFEETFTRLAAFDDAVDEGIPSAHTPHRAVG